MDPVRGAGPTAHNFVAQIFLADMTPLHMLVVSRLSPSPLIKILDLISFEKYKRQIKFQNCALGLGQVFNYLENHPDVSEHLSKDKCRFRVTRPLWGSLLCPDPIYNTSLFSRMGWFFTPTTCRSITSYWICCFSCCLVITCPLLSTSCSTTSTNRN